MPARRRRRQAVAIALSAVRIAAVWALFAWGRLGIERGPVDGSARDANFTVTGAKSLGMNIGVAQPMDIRLFENDRWLGGDDVRLPRARFAPAMARLARRFMPAPAAR